MNSLTGFSLALVLLVCGLATPAAALNVVTHAGGGLILPGKFGQFTNACAAGEILLSGGYAITPDYGSNAVPIELPMDRYFVYANYPSSASAWTAGVWNRSERAVNLKVFAACASSTAVPGIASQDGVASTLVTVKCPTGQPTGGGFRVVAGNKIKVVSIDRSLSYDAGWLVLTSQAGDTNGVTVTSYAVCNPTLGASVDPKTTFDVLEGVEAPTGSGNFTAGSGETQVACKDKGDIVGAGFGKHDDPSDAMVLTQLSPPASPAEGWRAKAFSLPVGIFSGTVPSHGTVDVYPIRVKRAPS